MSHNNEVITAVYNEINRVVQLNQSFPPAFAKAVANLPSFLKVNAEKIELNDINELLKTEMNQLLKESYSLTDKDKILYGSILFKSMFWAFVADQQEDLKSTFDHIRSEMDVVFAHLK